MESSVTVKLKGTSRSHLTPIEAGPIPDEWLPLYNRVWDEADYVVPPAENGAFFITTNVVLTPNQTQNVCPEDPSVDNAVCRSATDCSRGKYLRFGHGPMTGRCVPSDRRHPKATALSKACEIFAWCPVEMDALPLRDRPLMDRVDQYTFYVKNSIAFPYFGPQFRRNNVIPGPKPSLYHPVNNTVGQARLHTYSYKTSTVSISLKGAYSTAEFGRDVSIWTPTM